jgi:hypothetical protein
VHSAGAKPRKNSFTFWQEKEAEKLEAERKAERERRFGDISRESYARLVIASNSIAKLSGRGSAGPESWVLSAATTTTTDHSELQYIFEITPEECYSNFFSIFFFLH